MRSSKFGRLSPSVDTLPINNSPLQAATEEACQRILSVRSASSSASCARMAAAALPAQAVSPSPALQRHSSGSSGAATAAAFPVPAAEASASSAQANLPIDRPPLASHGLNSHHEDMSSAQGTSSSGHGPPHTEDLAMLVNAAGDAQAASEKARQCASMLTASAAALRIAEDNTTCIRLAKCFK